MDRELEKYITHKQALTYLFSVIGFVITVAIASITGYISLSNRVAVNEANRRNDSETQKEIAISLKLISNQQNTLNNSFIQFSTRQETEIKNIQETLKSK